jgi:hypothetical protein
LGQAHAHVATLHYLSTASNNPPSLNSLALALKHFCRSVELNDSYLRGYYGLKLLTSKLNSVLSDSSSNKRNTQEDDNDIPLPSAATVKKLEEIATSKLAEIVRRYKSGRKDWGGYDEAEIIAARELLDRDGKTER